jgi:hypothetical protein
MSFLLLGLSACAGMNRSGETPIEVAVSANDGTTTQGEPQIAINPTNPNNLVIVWTALPHPIDVNNLPMPFDQCPVAVSMDGGKSWKLADQPANHTTKYGCGDGVAAAGPDGTLYAGGGVTSFMGPGKAGPGLNFQGDAVVSSSRDGGKTWSAPISALGSFTPKSRFVSGNPVDPHDREWLAVDQSTGTLYVSSGNLPGGPPARFVTVSEDKGKTFGPIYAVDSTTHPTGGGGTIAVGTKGVFAVAYTATAAPGATCPCVIFETSTDKGANFDRHVVPVSNAARNPRPYIAGSQVEKGHFALMTPDAAGTGLQIYVTKDSGKTWSGPALLGEAPANQRFKPWITYAPSGELIVMWRTLHSDKTFDVWTAISRGYDGNGIAAFSAPLRASSVAAPYPPGPPTGDDYSWAAADKKYVHLSWGDGRKGATQVWYGRIPLSAFGAAPKAKD